MRILLDESDIFTLICAMAAFRKARHQFQCKKRDADLTDVRLFKRAREYIEVSRYKQNTY
jgi:hypothetical protein